ncbi:hypothetical protein [Shinella sp. M31]|uniref:hypothetical protein n=1 Tax=Shinella sp. M31 TaxID=3368615 RepID=UPI003BA35F25
MSVLSQSPGLGGRLTMTAAASATLGMPVRENTLWKALKFTQAPLTYWSTPVIDDCLQR